MLERISALKHLVPYVRLLPALFLPLGAPGDYRDLPRLVDFDASDTHTRSGHGPHRSGDVLLSECGMSAGHHVTPAISPKNPSKASNLSKGKQFNDLAAWTASAQSVQPVQILRLLIGGAPF